MKYLKDVLFCFLRAVLKKYLLEKSRISSQSNNERNYHVFYCLLSGASPAEKESLHLLEAKEYHYLNQVCKGYATTTVYKQIKFETVVGSSIWMSAQFDDF